MAMDTFICGACQETFHDINVFITHKNECTVKVVEESSGQEEQQVQHIIHVQLPDGQVGQLEGSNVTVLQPGEEAGEQVEQEHIITEEGQENQMCLVVKDSEGNADGSSEIHIVSLEKLQELTRDGTTTIPTQNGDVHVIVADSAPPPPKPAGRRPGRPRKSEEKKKPKEPAPKAPVRPELPEKGEDGKYHCARCKKAFGRERHYNTHRCLATTDYVDIMQEKELLSDEESEEEEEKYQDKSYDYKIGSRPRGRPPKNRRVIPQIKEEIQPTVAPDGEGNPAATDGSAPQHSLEAGGQNKTEDVQANMFLVPRTDSIPNIPVFASEEEKLAFEETLNVDLSMVDNMYKTHVIDQNVNEHAPPPASRTQSELSVYSCNVCDKVFKTVSHMRLHCLTHTDIKPFRCSHCNFAANSKGNLYTHMRIHTGQFYTCTVCVFHTPNKTHLVEHMATHSKVRQKCAICKKDYNTVKSLINHIRKYHPTKAGRDYLDRFQGKQNQGTAVLHQCHVCLRKFKKKIDRDRHLFVHNIKGITNVHECDLCDYTATRRSYLEQHFTRHRVVYACCICSSKFPSSVRLNQHLALNHKVTDSSDKWVDIFQQCISSSLYLPEPDGSTDNFFDNAEEESQHAAEILETGGGGGDGGNLKEGQAAKAVVIEPIEKSSDVNTTVSPDVDKTSLSGSQNNEGGQTNAAEADGENDTRASKPGNEEEMMEVEDEEEEEEAEMTEEALALEQATDYDIYKRLNYVSMKMEVFHKLRMTFGTEECEFCGRLFYSKSDFTVHVRTHTGERPYPCDQCSYRASTKDSLKRHTEKEHDKVTYVCQQCEFVASSRTQLWHHQQKHREPQEVECTLCTLKYPSAKRLRTHLSVQHPNLDKAEVKKMLSACQKTQGRLGRRSHKCPFCAKTFMRGSADLQKHIWIHQGIKPFKCNLCPHACRSKNNLMSHMLRHSADKPFLCTECNKAYKSRTALRWHIRTHKEGKIFRCVKCNYEAVQYSHLKRHMQTHDIVKRFVCQHCNYSANTLGYMKIHYTRHHKGHEYTHNPVPAPQMAPGTKVYRCLSCDYLFGNLSDIKRHLKVRHHVSVEDIHALENIESDQQQQQQQQTGGGSLQDASQLEQQVHQIQGMEPQVHQTVEVPIVVDENGEHVQQAHSEVQVVEMIDPSQVPATSEEQDASSALHSLQYAVPQTGMDEQTASAVNILQHIIGMSKQGAFGGSQQITVQAEDGQSFVVNPDTIIVQQDSEDQELVISGDGQDGGQQYVIQYVSQNPGQDEVITEVNPEVMEIDAPEVETTEVVTEENTFTDHQMDTIEVVELETPEMMAQYTGANEHDVRVVLADDVTNDVSVTMPSEATEVIEQIYTTVEGETTVEEEAISTEIITET